MTQTISPRGAFAIACAEGIVPGPYLDSVGVWTWGIGHTKAAGAPDPAAMARGMPADLDGVISATVQIFRHDLARYAAAVAAALTVPVTQTEFDALVSFHYNTGAIAKASLVKALNRGDRLSAITGFMSWVKPPEVVARRKKEQALFKTGNYPAGPVNVWQVTTSGRVVFKPIRTMAEADFIAAYQAASS
jgi:lysozyme